MIKKSHTVTGSDPPSDKSECPLLQCLYCLKWRWIHFAVNINPFWDFPGGPVVKNLPSNAGDVGLIPGRGIKIPHATGQLSPCTVEPTHHNKRAQNPHLLSARTTAREKPACCNEEPARCN